MKIKKRNHTVTRGYLANWKGQDQHGKAGIWYYDISSKKVCFSLGLKAPFAVKDYIYAPVYIGTDRDDRLENWFAESESELCNFSRNFGRAKPQRWKPKAIKKALASIVSSGMRGEYSITSMEDFFRRKHPLESDETIRLMALNNLYSASHKAASFFTGGSALIVEQSSPTFATNDQPFWDMSPRSSDNPTGIFPLSPTRLLVLLPHQKPVAGDMEFRIIKGRDVPTIVDFGKLAALRMARRWVVCSSQEEADKAASYLTDEVIEEAWATDRLLGFENVDRRSLFSLEK